MPVSSLKFGAQGSTVVLTKPLISRYPDWGSAGRPNGGRLAEGFRNAIRC
jgi:hypothetical protein